MGLEWLSIGILAFATIYWVVFKLISLISNHFIRKVFKSFFILFFIFSIAISVKLFAFDLFKINSNSMKETLYSGDIVLVNKLQYGPKPPNSPMEVPWINMALYLMDSTNVKNSRTDWWNFKRLSGSVEIELGDIIIYQFFRNNSFIIKRCVGKAGDKISIVDGEIIVNGAIYNPPETIRNTYRFRTKHTNQFYKEKDSLMINETLEVIEDGFMKMELSNNDLKKIKKLSCIDSIQLMIDSYDNTKNLFSGNKKNKWTLDNYGSIIIPKRGMEISLNNETYIIYKKLLLNDEKIHIKKIDNEFQINGIINTTYTFKQNYYFMVGDNRKKSIDSRHYGFVSEEKIVGKVQNILFSYENNKIRWDRFIKNIN